MRNVNGVTVGWLDTSIGALLTRTDDWLSRFAFVLITSIDSNSQLRQVPAATAIIEQFRKCKFLGNGLLVPTAAMSEIAARFHLFTGFDEVWCFDEEPFSPKPVDLSIVAPLNLDIDEPPPLLSRWLEESNCRLGLGDGIGLNFATPDRETAVVLDRVAKMSGAHAEPE